MSDETLKRAVLDAVLSRAASEGFNDKLIADEAGEAAGRLFPDGVPSLLAFYSHAVDAEMAARLAGLNLQQMPVRKRIRSAVETRLAILGPHKEAARRATLILALPPNAPMAAKLVYDTVDAMWRAAGDVSTDFAFYTKRASLGAVYTATLLRWFADAGGHETMAFLDARIENVMQVEKLKARLREGAKAVCGDLLCR